MFEIPGMTSWSPSERRSSWGQRNSCDYLKGCLCHTCWPLRLLPKTVSQPSGSETKLWWSQGLQGCHLSSQCQSFSSFDNCLSWNSSCLRLLWYATFISSPSSAHGATGSLVALWLPSSLPAVLSAPSKHDSRSQLGTGKSLTALQRWSAWPPIYVTTNSAKPGEMQSGRSGLPEAWGPGEMRLREKKEVLQIYSLSGYTERILLKVSEN